MLEMIGGDLAECSGSWEVLWLVTTSSLHSALLTETLHGRLRFRV